MRRPTNDSDVIDRVERTCRREQLWNQGDRIIAAVSGGVDSVALLHLMTRLAPKMDLRIIVVHVDHGLRGRSSKVDARFVEGLSQRLGLACHVEHLNLPKAAPKNARDASAESVWRDARHDVLVHQAKRRRAACIALAHHRDDVAETVLMRLIRGAGARGLGAFGPTSERDGVRIVRPLYDLTRNEIEQYARAQGLKWREDASNNDRDRLRNQVRHDLLPLLESEFNPSIREGLARTASTLREEDALLDELADAQWRALGGGQRAVPRDIPLDDLRGIALPLLRRVLRFWLTAISRSDYPPSFNEVERLMELIHDKPTGARFELRRRWAFVRKRERVVVETMRRK